MGTAVRWNSFCVLALVVSLSRLASAGESNAARAQRLFEEAARLVGARAYGDACPKLEESDRLDPAIGTEYNLADCYEHTRRPARALELFAKVAQRAHSAGKSERETSARARVAALEKSVPTLRLEVRADPTRTVITVDGTEVARDAWTRELRVDFGSHLVEARVAGREVWHQMADCDEARPHVEVVVPEVGRTATEERAAAPSASPQPPPSSFQRVLGLGLAGAGVVGIGVGSVFGVMALGRNKDAQRSACPNGGPCTDPRAVDLWKSANQAGDIATIAFVGGGALAAAGAVLWLTAPVNVTPTVTPHTGFVSVTTRF